MNIRTKQKIATLFWKKYSITFDRINQNALQCRWLRDNKSVPVFQDKFNYFTFINEQILKDEPIDFFEFGVYKGKSLELWTSLNKRSLSRFYGFDTFSGLPEDWFKGFTKGHFDVGGETPEISDERVRFVKGLFQDTLVPFLQNYKKQNKLVVHCDADLYSSTLYVLVRMHDFLSNGDIIMFDDFADPVGEFQAYNDYCKVFTLQLNPVAIRIEKNIPTQATFCYP